MAISLAFLLSTHFFPLNFSISSIALWTNRASPSSWVKVPITLFTTPFIPNYPFLIYHYHFIFILVNNTYCKKDNWEKRVLERLSHFQFWLQKSLVYYQEKEAILASRECILLGNIAEVEKIFLILFLWWTLFLWKIWNKEKRKSLSVEVRRFLWE